VVAAWPQVKITLDSGVDVGISYVSYMACQNNHVRTLNLPWAWRFARAASPEPFVNAAGGIMPGQKAKDNGRVSRQRLVGLSRSLVRNLGRKGYCKRRNTYSRSHIAYKIKHTLILQNKADNPFRINEFFPRKAYN
jgi:hypothetical protein